MTYYSATSRYLTTKLASFGFEHACSGVYTMHISSLFKGAIFLGETHYEGTHIYQPTLGFRSQKVGRLINSFLSRECNIIESENTDIYLVKLIELAKSGEHGRSIFDYEVSKESPQRKILERIFFDVKDYAVPYFTRLTTDEDVVLQIVDEASILGAAHDIYSVAALNISGMHSKLLEYTRDLEAFSPLVVNFIEFLSDGRQEEVGKCRPE